MTIRQILDDWASNGFKEPYDAHKHLFWKSEMTGWMPTRETIRQYKANPVPEKQITVGAYNLSICSGWDGLLVQLPSGEWVESRHDGIWSEYDGGWVVCWENSEKGVAYLFKV